MKIYTRKGDDGSTGLLFGGKVRKNEAAPEAYGAVDEAQAAIGLWRSPSTAPTSSRISTGCPICSGPWPGGRRAYLYRPARGRPTDMPITVTLSPQVPDDAQALGVPVYAGRRQPDRAAAELD